MTEIRELAVEDRAPFVEIVSQAYPGWEIASAADKEHMREILCRVREEPPPERY